MFALRIAQDGVDERTGLSIVGEPDSFINHCVGSDVGVAELEQANAQYEAEAVFESFVIAQMIDADIEQGKIADDAVENLLNESVIARFQIVFFTQVGKYPVGVHGFVFPALQAFQCDTSQFG